MSRSKYGNVRTTVDGITFHSKAEAGRWRELKVRERAGEIVELKRQPRFPIYGGIFRVATYVSDFAYYEVPIHAKSRLVVEDVKGKETEAFKLKWKIVTAHYPTIDWRLIPAKSVRAA